MNEDVFVIHGVLLIILTAVTFAAGIGFCVAYFNDLETFAGIEIKKRKWIFNSVISFLLFIGGTTWLVMSCNQPWKRIVVSNHEIKDVIWPDGTKTQMFSCDGTDYNITKMFEKIVDKETWVVKRIRWSPFYFGISWSTSERCAKDRFYLEDKNNPNKSIEL